MLGLVAGGLVGCGSKIPEGVPKNVDMSKDYSPAAKPFSFSPSDQAKAAAASKKAAAEDASKAEPAK